MELVHGRVITFDQADRLGVLSAAEGLIRESPDKPWQVVTPSDLPIELDGAGKDRGSGSHDTEDNKDHMADDKTSNVSLHRALHHLNKGGLHRALGVPEGDTIPADKLEAAKNSTNEHVRHMANFAATMGSFKHGK